jgi:hypothetical protein
MYSYFHVNLCLLSTGVYVTFIVSVTVLVNLLSHIYHYQEKSVCAYHPVLKILMTVRNSPVYFTKYFKNIFMLI